MKLTVNIVAKEIQIDGMKIEEEIEVVDLPLGEKTLEDQASIKGIHIDETKEVEKINVDRRKLREFLSKNEMTISHVRCIIVGCRGAGKTTLLRRLGNLTFGELKYIESAEIDDIHVNSFEVLEADETIQSK